MQNDNKGIVRDFYQKILKREPDPSGAEAYEGLIKLLGLHQAIPRMLGSFLESDEYQAQLTLRINSTLRSGGRLINGRPVAHLASLGPFCLASIILKDNGLKKYSLPFDWIFSNPHVVIDCLIDDFATFLDRRHYSSISHPTRKDPGAEHHVFRERYGITEFFAHRDPTREADYLYVVRCVERFRQLLHTDDGKVFLMIGRPADELERAFPAVIEKLQIATRNFILLCIEVTDPIEPGLSALTPVTKIGEHALYRFTPSSYDEERGVLPEKFDEWTILRLVYRYQLSLKDSPED